MSSLPNSCSAFGRKGDLTRHIKVVHEKRRDQACSYCKDAAFQTKRNLTRHMKTVHKKRRLGRKKAVAWFMFGLLEAPEDQAQQKRKVGRRAQ